MVKHKERAAEETKRREQNAGKQRTNGPTITVGRNTRVHPSAIRGKRRRRRKRTRTRRKKEEEKKKEKEKKKKKKKMKKMKKKEKKRDAQRQYMVIGSLAPMLLNFYCSYEVIGAAAPKGGPVKQMIKNIIYCL